MLKNYFCVERSDEKKYCDRGLKENVMFAIAISGPTSYVYLHLQRFCYEKLKYGRECK